MPNARLLGVLLVLWGCGGRTGSADTELMDGSTGSAATEPMDGSTPDASPGDGLLFQTVYLQEAPESGSLGSLDLFQCFDAGPVGDNGGANCVVVSAQFPSIGPQERIAACTKCDAPGLEPFVTSVPLESIGEGLSKYACLCAVTQLPSNAGCALPLLPRPGGSWWCYSASPPGGPACGQVLGFSPGLFESGTIYVACFGPETTP